MNDMQAMKMRLPILVVAILAATLSHAARAADAPLLLNARDIKWSDAEQPPGAKQALLWGDPKSSDHGTLLRWAFNTKAADLVRTQDVHIVVLTGTFTVSIGNDYREFGPGAAVTIPKGIKHTLGCEASGECKFVVHHPGAVEITTRRP